MDTYIEKIEKLKSIIEDKIWVHKAACKMRLMNSNFEEEEYVIEYHYLMLLEQYISREDAFKERVGETDRRINNKVLDKLISTKSDIVWNYIKALNSRYKSIDMVELFNNEIIKL